MVRMYVSKILPFHSVSIQDPFIFLSISVLSQCRISVCFESVLYLLRVRDTCTVRKLLHEAVYDFYSLLKSVHAGQQFVCGRKKDSDSLTTLIWIVLALASHTSLDHKLCLRAFLLLFLQLDSVVVLFARSWL